MLNDLKTLAIEVIAQCNLSCNFCTRNASSKDTRKMTVAQIRHIIKDAKECETITDFAITGGEPMMHPQIEEIVELLSDSEYRVSITTNGTILNRDLINNIFSKDNFKHFIVSIDSNSDFTHDNIRGLGSFAKTDKFLKTCSELEIPFLINMTVNQQNYKDVQGTVRYAKEAGAKDISVALVKPNGRGFADLNPNIRKIVYTGISDLSMKEKFSILPSEVLSFFHDDKLSSWIKEEKPEGGCSLGQSSLHIQVNGEILACTSCDGFSIGNVFEDKNPVMSAWNSTALNNLRDRNNLKGVCNTCEYRESCGGCRCRAFGVTGDIFSEDPYCPLVMKT